MMKCDKEQENSELFQRVLTEIFKENNELLKMLS